MWLDPDGEPVVPGRRIKEKIRETKLTNFFKAPRGSWTQQVQKETRR